MKNLSITFILLALLSGCTKNIESLNVDPKSALSVPSGSLFLKGEKSLMDAYTTTSVSVAPFRVLSQEWTENTYVYEAQYNLSAYQSPSGWWNALYSASIHNLQYAKDAYQVDVLDPAVRRNDAIITDILQVYAYYLLVATYGNIPYSQAENKLIPFPKYDDAKTVYADLLTRIDTCIVGLNPAAAAMGSNDKIYGGKVAKWKKFAATLKLKMAMLGADVDNATTSKKVQEAIATGIFTSNDDNALMAYDASAPSNSNPIWQALVNSGRHDFAPTSFLVSTMVGLNDPRVPIYFTLDGNSAYTGAMAGGGNNYGSNSDFGASFLQATFPGDLLDYSETQFYLAEAAAHGISVGGTPDVFYNNAITASIIAWGGVAADAATYLAQPSVAYATAAGDFRQKIGYQEWISFYNKNWDSWTVIRRLNNPNLNIVSPPIAAKGKLPLRFTYPSDEKTSNSINFSAAAATLPGGIDVVSAKLWFML